MLEFLVKEMGFTVFAIEASYPACMNINDFVLYGKGDRSAALASQKFWTWDTNEVGREQTQANEYLTAGSALRRANIMEETRIHRGDHPHACDRYRGEYRDLQRCGSIAGADVAGQ